MIPLDRVRAMVAAATPGPWVWRSDDTDGCHVVEDPRARYEEEERLAETFRESTADIILMAAAPDLARDVLTLADALATAERERDEARAERDTARSALDGLAAAVRAEREARRVARLAQSERDALEDDAWPDGDDDERAALAAAGERLDTAEADHDAKRDHLTALLAGAPCGYVEARVVRAYLAAVEAFDGGALGAPCRASIRVDNTRAALVAALEK